MTIRIDTCYNVYTEKRGIYNMPITPKEMIKILTKNGFVEISSTGSHRKMFNPETSKITIVPYHNKSLSKGLEQAILKQAGLKGKKEQ